MWRRRSSSTLPIRTGVVALLVGSLATVGPARSGAQVDDCTEPYPATYAAVTYPAPPTPPPWDGGRELDHEPAIFDTDGDGTADTITDLPGNAIRITRSTGSISFPAQTYLANRFDPADLDGDGGTDLVVILQSGGETGGFVVPGSVASGPVDAATEAIRVPDPVAGSRPVGDQDGDGTVDLAAPSQADGFGDTLVYSGAAITAPGPGGTAADVDPFLELDGLLVGRIPFDAGPPTLVTAEGTTVVVHDDEPVELTVLGSGVRLPYVSQTTTGATGVVDGDATWLVLGHGDRSGNKVWGWRLDDPCGTIEPAPEPPEPGPADPGTAPPASPVDGTASYTG